MTSAAILAVAILCSCSYGLTVREFLLMPAPEPECERSEVTGREFVQESAGAHEGHRVYEAAATLSPQEQPPYAVHYGACLEDKAHPGLIEVWPREGLSGVGLSKPTGANWYAGGCIDVVFNGQSVGPWKPRITRFARGDGSGTVRLEWKTRMGAVTLEFHQPPRADYVLVHGSIGAATEVQSLKVRLLCYPSGYAEPRDRRITTAVREDAKGRSFLTRREFWVLYTDAEHDLAADPESKGCCALMFPRSEVLSAWVKATSYPVNTTLDYPAGTREFHLGLWEFPKKTNAEAKQRMQALAANLEQQLGQEATVAVRTEGVPPGGIVHEREPAGSIVLPAEPTEYEMVAAEELQRYLARISGAVLPIVLADRTVAGNKILLETAAAEAGVEQPTVREGYTLTGAADGLLIRGNSDLGTLYGVYGLLEDHLGVRWYLPGDLGECVPQRANIAFPDLKDQRAPSFEMRWIGTGQWALRNRQNRCENGFVVRPGIYHTQNALLPHAKYFPEHPEYFALVKGERSKERHCKLCTSNPEVAREVAKNMAAMLDEDPSIDLISLSPTDGMLYCECENCKAEDEPDVPRDQRMSRRMLLFYNRVAEELAKTHPEARILVGAYHIYTWPPKDEAIKAHPSLNVIICHYEDYCMAHSVADETCPRNERYRELIKAWQDLGCKVYFYEYYWKVNWFDLPWPIVHSLAGDLPYYKQIGVGGVYTQYTTSNIWTLFPGHYVAAKLLWDVDADVRQIMDEFYARFFGRAAAPMREYYETLETQMATCGEHFPGQGLRYGPHVFTAEIRQKMRTCIQRANELAQDDRVKERLAKIALCLEYTERLMSYADAQKPVAEAEGAAQRAQALEEAAKILGDLCEEVATDRARWEGIVSKTVVTSRGYLGRVLENARRRAAQAKLALGETIADLPKSWKFRLDPENVGEKGKWFAPDHDDGDWKDIEIGKTWESQGYDYDGYAWYRLRLTLKQEWLSQPARLKFEAVDGVAWVYLDSELLAHHEGWDEPFAVPLDPEKVKPDTPHVLAVRVYDGSNQGGIWRPVTLQRVPTQE